MAERSLPLLLAVHALVERREDRPLSGGAYVTWPYVLAVLQHLQPDANWSDSTVRKAYRTVKGQQSAIDAMIAGVQIPDLPTIVNTIIDKGAPPSGVPPIIPGVNQQRAPEGKKEPAREQYEGEPSIEDDLKVLKLEKQAEFFRKGYKKLLEEKAVTDQILETIMQAVVAVDPITPADIPAPTILLWNRPRVMVPVLSDMHVGEKVDGKKIKGFNHFNFDILDERIDRWCSDLEERFQHERAAGPVERIVLPILGDMITGENIYRGQWMHIEETAMHQIFVGAEKMSGALLRLARLGVPIDVYGVGGNHARMGRRGESDFSNDFLLYKFLEAKLERQPNLHFNFDYAFWTTWQLWDWRFYGCHGDNIRGWGGYPWYGSARAEANTQMLQLTQGNYHHFFLHGHFHTDMSLQTPVGKRFANGNWIGTTEYGVNGGFGGRPSQKLLVVTEKGGVESELTLYLDDITPDFMNRAAAGHGLGMSLEPSV